MSLTPNFLCIGAQKAGTTLLYEQLKTINDVYLPTTKEVHFFDRPAVFQKGIRWYLDNYFKGAEGHTAIGEVTPSYLFIDFVPKLIFESFGNNIKFIVLLRNPIERAYSHYLMKYRTKEENKAFHSALILEGTRIKKSLQYQKKYSYLQRGLYSQQITNYLRYFHKDNFLFILFNEFTEDQDACVKHICDFLGIDKNVAIENKAVHNTQLSLTEKLAFALLNKNHNLAQIFTSAGYPDLSAEMRETLQEYYSAEVASLEAIVDRDLSAWLQ